MDNIRGYFGWLFKHPIAFAWILAFIAIALNWLVSGKEMHAPEAKNAAHAQMAHAKPQHAPMAHGQGNEAAAPAAEGQAAPAPMTNESQTASTTAQPAPEAAPVQATAPAPEAAAAPAPAATQASNEVQPVDTVTPAVATTTMAAEGNADLTSLLRSARQAYWDGVNTNDTAKLEESVSFYEKLVAQDANPAYKGELANVFWKMEKPDKAADLYIEIGPWLKEQGRTIELINMKVYVDITNPEKGKKLGALIGQ